MTAFLDRVGVKITSAVGSMWCAIGFAALACVSLPSVVQDGRPTVVVAWVAQTFLQLVLLSIILVGQRVQAAGIHGKLEEHHQAIKDHVSEAIASTRSGDR